MPHRPNKRAGRGLPLILLQLLLCGSAFAVEPKPDSAGAGRDGLTPADAGIQPDLIRQCHHQ
jgi:hypothetical protein